MKKFYTTPATENAISMISEVLQDLEVNPTSAYNGEFDAPARGGDIIEA